MSAFEMLIGKGTGQIYSEYGLNMMWNTKFDMMRNGHGDMMDGFKIFRDCIIFNVSCE